MSSSNSSPDPAVPPTQDPRPDPAVPPTQDPRPDPSERERTPSVVVVNTGDGKGKSSAAFGVMVRALARDWKVAVVQFLKSGNWHTGEEQLGTQLGVDWWTLGEGFTWDSQNLSQDEATAQAAWQHAKEIIASGDYRLVILDEITYPMNWGWIDSTEVIEALQSRPSHVNIVATGRDASAELIEAADTASEVLKLKHAYDQGIMAQAGLDF